MSRDREAELMRLAEADAHIAAAERAIAGNSPGMKPGLVTPLGTSANEVFPAY